MTIRLLFLVTLVFAAIIQLFKKSQHVFIVLVSFCTSSLTGYDINMAQTKVLPPNMALPSKMRLVNGRTQRSTILHPNCPVNSLAVIKNVAQGQTNRAAPNGRR